MPVNPNPVFGFVTVKVRTLVPASGMLDGAKLATTLGGVATVIVAVPVLPVLPLVELMVVELFFTPTAVPVTFTTIVQVAFTPTAAPVKETVPLPGVAVAVPAQLFVRPLGLETVRPAGILSVKETPD